MTLNQLIYFREIGRSQTISEAARKLFISQQALSKALQQLEHELSSPLVCRQAGRISLTDKGELFLTEANAILDRMDQIPSVLNPDQEHYTVLKAAYPTSMFGETGGLCHLSCFDPLRLLFPEVRIDFHEMYNDECVTGLIEHQFDFIFTTDVLNFELYDNRMIFQSEVRCILSLSNPLAAGGDVLTLKQLAGETFLFPAGTKQNPLNIYQAYFQAMLESPRLEQFIFISCTLYSLLDHVAGNEGISIVPVSILPCVDTGKVKICRISPAVEIPINLCSRRDHPHARLFSRYADIMREQLKSRKDNIPG